MKEISIFKLGDIPTPFVYRELRCGSYGELKICLKYEFDGKELNIEDYIIGKLSNSLFNLPYNSSKRNKKVYKLYNKQRKIENKLTKYIPTMCLIYDNTDIDDIIATLTKYKIKDNSND